MREMIRMIDGEDKDAHVCLLVSPLFRPRLSCVGDTETSKGTVNGSYEDGR